MDSIVLAAGTSLVGAMMTDGWRQVRTSTVALWHRVRPEAAQSIDQQLAEDHLAVVTAREAGDVRTEQTLMEAWQHRFHQLQTDDRRNDELLRQLVDEVMVPALAAVTATERNAVKMTAKSSGHGRVYQSGRDQTINEG